MGKKNLVKVITPVGDLMYVNIEGQGKENYNEDGYEYVATVHLNGAKSEKLRAQIDEVIGPMATGESLKSKGYRQLAKDDEGNIFTPSKAKPATAKQLIDLYAFGFKTSTLWPAEEGQKPKPKVIGVFGSDPKKKVSLGGKKVGNGTQGAISGNMERTVYKKEVSCSLYLNAIQITKFIAYDDDAGFEAQDGDFDGVVDDDTGFTSQVESKSEDDIPTEFAGNKPRL